MEYKVSELAEKAGVTKRTIHYYISKGLLLPPDGNGVNDSFIPVLTAGYDRTGGYVFRIYDRWGELIFVTNQVLQGWDGTYNGEKVQFGTYTWTIRFKDSQTNEVYESTGHVNVIR